VRQPPRAAVRKHTHIHTWFMSCTCPVMRAMCDLLVDGVHRNMVWSSEPLTSRSGWPRTTASYRCCAAYVNTNSSQAAHGVCVCVCV
jgi:hypothetical protein